MNHEFFVFATLGKRFFSDIETDDGSVQKDVQLEQHEEAQPKKKAKGLDFARPGEPLGRNAPQAVTDNSGGSQRMVGTRRWRDGRSARPGKQNESSH